jgi:hypothetical protein
MMEAHDNPNKKLKKEAAAIESFKRLSSEIFPSVYDWFFADDAFVRWRKARLAWPLHCIGSPGAGKVGSVVLNFSRADHNLIDNISRFSVSTLEGRP